MSLNLELITYSSLNPRQKENYNYQKLSALLADYGFVTMRLSDDWQGADMIAQQDEPSLRTPGHGAEANGGRERHQSGERRAA